MQGCSPTRYVIAGVRSPSIERRRAADNDRHGAALNPGQSAYPGQAGRLAAQQVSLFAKTPATATWQDRNRTDQRWQREQGGHVTMVEEQPKWRTGKICYIEIPAADVARSAEFYQQAFGWKMRQRG